MTTEADWAGVVAAAGRAGTLAADGTSYRIGFPRRDLSVTSAGVMIKPGFALGSYAAFAQYPDHQAMLMGDLVVTQPEMDAVTDALTTGGVEITALHHHLLDTTPTVWWMHIGGMGNPVTLIQTVKTALDATATPPATPPVELDTARIDTALGHAGTNDGGIYKFTISRQETISEHHHVVPPGLGVTTALNFQPLGGGKAAINGDFAMTENEVQTVTAALRHGPDHRGVTAQPRHRRHPTPVLHPLLGHRRRRRSGQGAAGRPRPDRHELGRPGGELRPNRDWAPHVTSDPPS